MDRTEIDARQHRADQALLRGHPVDALEAIAHQAGRELDPVYAAEMRALCDEVVPTPRKGDWMQTYTGRQYWPLDPRADEVEVEDIAHHLSMLCRYCGACLQFWSVAEHSVGVLAVVEGDMRRNLRLVDFDHPLARAFRLHALLHDGPEAYCHDLIRPIKRSVQGYDQVEAANAAAIAVRFNLPMLSEVDQARIKLADNAMLLAEQEVLMAPAPAKWAQIEVPHAMLQDARAFIARNGGRTLDPAAAKALFRAEFAKLADA